MHFETKGTPPPNFVSIDINDRHAFGATIEWRTNIPVEARFYSGHDSENLQYRTEHPVLHPAHRVELEGFYPDSTVYYRIEIEDERGRIHETGLRQFKTRENNIAWRQPVEGTFDQPRLALTMIVLIPTRGLWIELLTEKQTIPMERPRAAIRLGRRSGSWLISRRNMSLTGQSFSGGLMHILNHITSSFLQMKTRPSMSSKG